MPIPLQSGLYHVIVAVVLIVALTFLAYAHVLPIAVYTGLIGAIIGYYFGALGLTSFKQ
ncbi:MAG: hypothetical protein QXT84_06215 [Candidatus Bathyarchaeia archaeon]